MSKSDFWAGISLITVLNFFFQILLDTITANLFFNTKSRETDVSLSSYHLYIFLWFFFFIFLFQMYLQASLNLKIRLEKICIFKELLNMYLLLSCLDIGIRLSTALVVQYSISAKMTKLYQHICRDQFLWSQQTKKMIVTSHAKGPMCICVILKFENKTVKRNFSQGLSWSICLTICLIFLKTCILNDIWYLLKGWGSWSSRSEVRYGTCIGHGFNPLRCAINEIGEE